MYRHTLEEEEITTSKIVWTRLIDVENCLIGIKGMKAESNEACFYKLEHIMVRGKQPTYQRERSIRLIAENGKDMIIDPKPREITPATMCWPIEGHLDQLSWTHRCIYGELKDVRMGQSWFKFSGTTRKLGGKLF